jgi:ATP-binding cassette subfamily B protein
MTTGGLRERLSSYFRLDIYLRLLPYLWPYRMAAVVVMALSVVASLLSLASPWPMAILIDSGLNGKKLPGWLEPVPLLGSGHAYEIIVFAVLGGVFLKVFRNGLEIVEDYLKTRVNWKMIFRFRCDLFEHFQKLSFSYHDRVPVGDSLYRLEEDTNFISTLIWSNFRNIITSIVTFGTMLFILLKLDWQVALIALASMPITLVAIAHFTNKFRGRSKRIKEMQAASQTIAQEVLSSLRVVKAFGQEKREQLKYEAQSEEAMWASLRLRVQDGLLSLALGVINNLNRAAIVLLGAIHVHQGQLSIGELLVVIAYVDSLYSPIQNLGDVVANMQLSLASGERTIEVLDVEPDVQDRPGAMALDRVAGAVEFEGVNFSYATGTRVLHDIGFSATPGAVVAIVGPTGAGKSTIASLLVRFYDPESGRVTLDGHDLRDLTVKTLRDNIGLVLQEPILFSTTVRENIAYGRPDATMEEIVAAARAANAHEFIVGFPKGYETEVGQRGVSVSGGERQRIAIARTFLKDSPVLILDEPTSSIDSRTEVVILDALERLIAGRTTFIIAHRLSTLRRAETILVLDHGRVVEVGTHAELVLRGGLYAELYRLQTAPRESDEPDNDLARVSGLS